MVVGTASDSRCRFPPEITGLIEMTPLVSVGIVNYNGLHYLPGCLASLVRQTEVELEITVVDNASTDGSFEWLVKNWPGVSLIRNEDNVGFSRGHNQIIQRTHRAYYLALNPDVVLERDFIVRLAEKAAAHTDCGWVCGKLLTMGPDGTPGNHVYTVGHAILRDGYAFNIGYGEVDTGQFEVPGEVFGANGAAVLYKRDMLLDMQERLGEFFDETMFHYFSDTDLDWRGQLLGWRCCYVPQAVAYHRGDYTGAQSNKWLIAHGLGSRYVSLFKNAFAGHLAFYAVPLFTMHCALRVAASPRMGLAMLKQVLQNLGHIREKRAAMAQRRRVSRLEMQHWFAWSVRQAREQRLNLSNRVRRFISGV